MKKILLLIPILLLISCGDSQEIKKDKSKDVKTNLDTSFLDKVDEDKIALISVIYNVPSKNVKSIIINFNKKYDYLFWNNINCDAECYVKIINEISTEINLPKEKVSLIIFKYRFSSEYIENYDIDDGSSSDVDYPYTSDYDNFR